MIGNACIGVNCPEVALELYADRSDFKLYLGDTGLLMLRSNGYSLYFHEFLYRQGNEKTEKV